MMMASVGVVCRRGSSVGCRSRGETTKKASRSRSQSQAEQASEESKEDRRHAWGHQLRVPQPGVQVDADWVPADSQARSSRFGKGLDFGPSPNCVLEFLFFPKQPLMRGIDPPLRTILYCCHWATPLCSTVESWWAEFHAVEMIMSSSASCPS